MAKLTRDEVQLIRRKKALGCKNTTLMKTYKLSYAELRQVLDDPIINKGEFYGH